MIETGSKKAYARLRQRAETILKETENKRAETTDPDLLETLHELEVHQVELDLQNETLRRIAKNLEAARDEYFAFYEFAPVGFVTLDKTGIIEKANAAAAHLLQQPQRYLVSQTFSNRVYPEDLPAYLGKIRKISESGVKGAKESLELRLFGKDDHIRHFHLDVGAGFDEQGRFRHWQLAIVDITELRQTREILQKTHVELESRVQERTAELEKLNEELRREIEKRKKYEAELKSTGKKVLKAQERRRILSKQLVDMLEAERQDMARTLHDEVGQIFTTINMDLDFLKDRSGDHHLVLEDEIEKIQNRVRESMDYVSGLSRSLRPHILDDLGLVPALRSMLQEINERSPIAVHFHAQDFPPEIDPEKALAVYRIAQEAMRNCVRHARAKNVVVNLVQKDQFISIAVEDDGIGFEYDDAMLTTGRMKKLGIVIMNERAVQVQGEFHMESRLGKGTRLMAEIPLR